MLLKNTIINSNTGLDAIKRAPILEFNTGLKCLRIQDISQSKHFSNWGNTSVSNNDLVKYKLLKGDILIARTGATVGVNMFIKKDINSVYNNGLIRLKVSTDYIPYYIFLALQSNKFSEYIKAVSCGTSAQPNLQIGDLLNYEFKEHPLIEQQHIVNILGSIDDKIENLDLITKKLQQEIKLNFIKEYNNLMSENVIALKELVSETVPGDWGKDLLDGNYATEVTCVRGADLPDLKNCSIDNAPTRFIINKNYISKKLQEYDFIVEMSGGSPTQSTGRTAFIPKGFENISNNLICTNFCKAIRCKNKENAIYCYLLFDMWYDSGLFFNYEIGTTGLKNFNLDALLGLDIKCPTDDFLYNISKKFDLFYNKVIENSQKIKKLKALKQLYLNKFFD